LLLQRFWVRKREKTAKTSVEVKKNAFLLCFAAIEEVSASAAEREMVKL